jgi:protein O-GlcNAc transferase
MGPTTRVRTGTQLKLAVDCHRQGRLAEAEANYLEALRLDPHQPDAWHLLGVVLTQTGRAAQGAEHMRRSLSLRPDQPMVYANLGNALSKLGRWQEAIASYRKALALQSSLVDTHHNLGLALAQTGRLDEALECYTRTLERAPGYLNAWIGRGQIHLDRGRYQEALAALDEALRLQPDQPTVLFLRGRLLAQLARPADAAECLREVYRIDPAYEYILGARLWVELHLCQWSEHAALIAQIEMAVNDGKAGSYPFMLFSACDSPELQLRCAREFSARHRPAVPPLWQGTRYHHDRIRIAYVSEDFRSHPTAYLLMGLWEQHDRQRFEIIAISLRPEEDSALGRRVKSAFDRFIDVSGLADAEIARRMRDLEIDIAVDLMGYSGAALHSILARRPAPVQVNYLGYPGTLGSADADYLIADEFLIPEANRSYFTEQVVYIPGTYQPNDSRRALGAAVPSRAATGLPPDGFVWCSFNNAYKLTPRLLDIWCRLLQAVLGSVLWLIPTAKEAERNLRNELTARGIDPARLIIAPSVPNPEHVARIALADLCLDTSPVNGATTTSDALWAGVPVVTCAGRSFVSRMAGSLLTGVGLPELITTTWRDYEELALALASEPERLARLRAKLHDLKSRSALFDTDRARKHLESAYLTMWERQRRGEPPASFAVEELR